MTNILHKIMAAVSESDKLAACLRLCDVMDIGDVILLDDITLDNMESYVGQKCAKMNVEERRRYLNNDMLHSPQNFMFSPAVRQRILNVCATINNAHKCMPMGFTSMNRALCDVVKQFMGVMSESQKVNLMNLTEEKQSIDVDKQTDDSADVIYKKEYLENCERMESDTDKMETNVQNQCRNLSVLESMAQEFLPSIHDFVMPERSILSGPEVMIKLEKLYGNVCTFDSLDEVSKNKGDSIQKSIQIRNPKTLVTERITSKDKTPTKISKKDKAEENKSAVISKVKGLYNDDDSGSDIPLKDVMKMREFKNTNLHKRKRLSEDSDNESSKDSCLTSDLLLSRKSSKLKSKTNKATKEVTPKVKRSHKKNDVPKNSSIPSTKVDYISLKDTSSNKSSKSLESLIDSIVSSHKTDITSSVATHIRTEPLKDRNSKMKDTTNDFSKGSLKHADYLTDTHASNKSSKTTYSNPRVSSNQMEESSKMDHMNSGESQGILQSKIKRSFKVTSEVDVKKSKNQKIDPKGKVELSKIDLFKVEEPHSKLPSSKKSINKSFKKTSSKESTSKVDTGISGKSSGDLVISSPKSDQSRNVELINLEETKDINSKMINFTKKSNRRSLNENTLFEDVKLAGKSNDPICSKESYIPPILKLLNLEKPESKLLSSKKHILKTHDKTSKRNTLKVDSGISYKSSDNSVILSPKSDQSPIVELIKFGETKELKGFIKKPHKNSADENTLLEDVERTGKSTNYQMFSKECKNPPNDKCLNLQEQKDCLQSPNKSIIKTFDKVSLQSFCLKIDLDSPKKESKDHRTSSQQLDELTNVNFLNLNESKKKCFTMTDERNLKGPNTVVDIDAAESLLSVKVDQSQNKELLKSEKSQSQMKNTSRDSSLGDAAVILGKSQGHPVLTQQNGALSEVEVLKIEEPHNVSQSEAISGINTSNNVYFEVDGVTLKKNTKEPVPTLQIYEQCKDELSEFQQSSTKIIQEVSTNIFPNESKWEVDLDSYLSYPIICSPSSDKSPKVEIVKIGETKSNIDSKNKSVNKVSNKISPKEGDLSDDVVIADKPYYQEPLQVELTKPEELQDKGKSKKKKYIKKTDKIRFQEIILEGDKDTQDKSRNVPVISSLSNDLHKVVELFRTEEIQNIDKDKDLIKIVETIDTKSDQVISPAKSIQSPKIELIKLNVPEIQVKCKKTNFNSSTDTITFEEQVKEIDEKTKEKAASQSPKVEIFKVDVPENRIKSKNKDIIKGLVKISSKEHVIEIDEESPEKLKNDPVISPSKMDLSLNVETSKCEESEVKIESKKKSITKKSNKILKDDEDPIIFPSKIVPSPKIELFKLEVPEIKGKSKKKTIIKKSDKILSEESMTKAEETKEKSRSDPENPLLKTDRSPNVELLKSAELQGKNKTRNKTIIKKSEKSPFKESHLEMVEAISDETQSSNEPKKTVSVKLEKLQQRRGPKRKCSFNESTVVSYFISPDIKSKSSNVDLTQEALASKKIKVESDVCSIETYYETIGELCKTRFVKTNYAPLKDYEINFPQEGQTAKKPFGYLVCNICKKEQRNNHRTKFNIASNGGPIVYNIVQHLKVHFRQKK